jgi:hypothetical protein
MSSRRTPLLVSLLVLLALAVGGSAANAERIGFEPGGAITMSGPLTLVVEGTTVECNVTLTGSLTRALVSTARGTNLGSITESAGTCRDGTGLVILIPQIILNEVVLRGPRSEVTGWLVRIANIGILIERVLGTQRCLYGTTLELLIGTSRTTAVVRLLREPLTLRLVRSLNVFSCPGVTLATSLTMTPGQEGIFLAI